MKLGIKTTDGVSKLKLKTADGISKAVPCACCDPCSGLWGPGYDDWPDALNVSYLVEDSTYPNGQYSDQCPLPIPRIAKCGWQSYDSNGLLFFELYYITSEEEYNDFPNLFPYPGPHFRIQWELPGAGSNEDFDGICFPPDARFISYKTENIETPLGDYVFEYTRGPVFVKITVTITAAS